MNYRSPAFILMLIAVTAASMGCGSRPGNQFNPLAGFGSPRISPPPTGGYHVPSLSGAPAADPYYGPAPSVAPQQAPPPGGGVRALPASSPQEQWRPAGSNPPNENTSSSSTAPWPGSPPRTGGQVAAGPVIQSTTVDVAADPTRLPANDALHVRAPSRFAPQGHSDPMEMAVAHARSGSRQIPGTLEYHTRPVPMGAPAQTTHHGQPLTVAQGTTVQHGAGSHAGQPANPNYATGWRDRQAPHAGVHR